LDATRYGTATVDISKQLAQTQSGQSTLNKSTNMSTQHVLDYDDNVYLAVTISSSSRFLENPAALAVHPALSHIGTVGQLRDVQLLSAPRESWPRIEGDILASLNSLEGVRSVDVQDPPRTRVKRGDDL